MEHNQERKEHNRRRISNEEKKEDNRGRIMRRMEWFFCFLLFMINITLI